MRASLIALCLAVSPALAHADAQAGAMPDWIAGQWLSCANGEAVREAWTGAGTGLLAGANVTHGGSAPRFEFMRIGPHERGVAFFGSPGGAPPVPFTMVSHEKRRAVFENLAHDFPQRVIYARKRGTLIARIEGPVNGVTEAVEWRFRRTDADDTCR